MLLTSKIIKPSSALYTYHFIFIFLSVALLFPKDHIALPGFIMVGVFFFISTLHRSNAWSLGVHFNKSPQRRPKRFSKYFMSVSSIFLSSLLTPFFVVFSGCTDYYPPPTTVVIALFLGIILYLIYNGIRLYISNTANYRKKEKDIITYGAKFLWAGSSLLIFNLSKCSVMRFMDITYTDASSTITVYVYFAITFMVFSVGWLIIANVSMFIHSGKAIEVECKNKTSKLSFHLKYSPAPVIFPVAASILVLFSCYCKNYYSINFFLASQAIRMDTSEGFYCGGEYKVIEQFTGERYMLISEGEYRVFVPQNEDLKSYRLTCTEEPPHYKLSFILNEAYDISLQMKVNHLKKEIGSND